MLLEEAEGHQKYIESISPVTSVIVLPRMWTGTWNSIGLGPEVLGKTRTQSGTAVAGGHLCYIPAKNMTVFCLCPENPYRAEF